MQTRSRMDNWHFICFQVFILISLFSFACLSQRAGNDEGPTIFQDSTEGKCAIYHGSACTEHVGSRKSIYIRGDESQQKNEHIVEEIKNSIKENTSGCFSTLVRVACLHYFPPCQSYRNASYPLRTCKEHCKKLKNSPCSQNFMAGNNHLRSILATNCDTLPNIDSHTGEGCARLMIPDIQKLREEACRRQHQTRGRSFKNANVVQPARDKSAICANVNWKQFDSDVMNILNEILPTPYNKGRLGRFALSASDVYCFHMSLNFSALVDDVSTYQNLVSLPRLEKPSLTSLVPGFSVKVGEKKAEQLTFPIGFLSNYVLDQNIVIPNVTLYYTANKSGTKLFGEGAYNLCGTEFHVRIEQTGSDATFLSGSSSQPMHLSTVELAFGMKKPMGYLHALQKRLEIMDKRLTNPKIRIAWDNDGKRVMRFSGKSSFSLWKSPMVDIEFILGPEQRYWLVGARTEGKKFEDIFHMLSGAKYYRMGKVLDLGIELVKMGLVLATNGASNPVQKPLQFESKPLRRMVRETYVDKLFFEAEGKIKENCNNSEHRTTVCKLLSLAIGPGTKATIKAEGTWSTFYFEIGFMPNTSNSFLSASKFDRLKKIWKFTNLLPKIGMENIEVAEDNRTDYSTRLPGSNYFWFQRIQINVEFWSFPKGLHLEKPVEIKAYFFYNSKRYTYRIRNITLDKCLTILNDIWNIDEVVMQ